MVSKRYFQLSVLTLYISTAVSLNAAELNLPNYPLQTSGFVEPNVMLLFDNSNSMKNNQINGRTRLAIAKEVAVDLVNNTPDVRFCLALFNNNLGNVVWGRKNNGNMGWVKKGNGGEVAYECKIPIPTSDGQTDLGEHIAGLDTFLTTALAGTYYEVIEYFRDGSSVYKPDSALGRTSPIQYRCQKNFTIVLTDGAPYLDDQFPGFKDKNGNEDGTGNYDLSPLTEDGYPMDSQSWKAKYFFLDDMAQYAYETDLRGAAELDEAGKSYNDSLFPRQNMSTYTVAFTLDATSNAAVMLQEAAEKEGYGHGKYYTANDSTGLAESFSNALQKITDTSYSVAGSSASGSQLSAGLNIYQTRYTEKNWAGELFALRIDPSTYAVSSTPTWTALHDINHVQRVVFTGLDEGILFNENSIALVDIVGNNQVLMYIRGDDSQSNYRDNTPAPDNELIMGDVVNSAPVFVPAPAAQSGYQNDPYAVQYEAFYQLNKDRNPMIYVGANDGMLHGFNADTGLEKFAYIPTKVLPYLNELTDPDYQHRFFVDGSQSIRDVYSNNAWRTLLVGGLGRGGQGIYAIDVTDTNPANNASAAQKLFQWEFSDEDDADLGFTYSEPQIMRLNDGKFYVVLANGYNSTSGIESDLHRSTSGDAVIYLLDIETGAVVKKLSTGVGIAESGDQNTANGMATVTGIDSVKLENDLMVPGQDGLIDYLYAGDLFGNVWKFDLSASGPTAVNEWGEIDNQDYQGTNLFTATDRDGNSQPITVPLTVVKLPLSQKTMIYFGTGKFLEASDTQSNNIGLQTFYALEDSGATISSRAQLVEQSIVFQRDVAFSVPGSEDVHREVRITSDNEYTTTAKGWFMDLRQPVDNSITQASASADTVYQELGEQVIAKAVYRDSTDGASHFSDGRIFFVAQTSDFTDPCLPNSKNFLMELSAETGSRFDYKAFDINSDGNIDDSDGVEVEVDGQTISVSVSGLEVASGQAPLFVDVLDSSGVETDKELIVINSGKVTDAGESKLATILSQKYQPTTVGKRLSWREIRSD